MPALRLLQDDGEAPSSEAETLRDSSGNSHLGSVAWDTKSLAQNPHSAGAIVQLEYSVTECAE